jgi:hypothetical protein
MPGFDSERRERRPQSGRSDGFSGATRAGLRYAASDGPWQTGQDTSPENPANRRVRIAGSGKGRGWEIPTDDRDHPSPRPIPASSTAFEILGGVRQPSVGLFAKSDAMHLPPEMGPMPGCAATKSWLVATDLGDHGRRGYTGPVRPVSRKYPLKRRRSASASKSLPNAPIRQTEERCGVNRRAGNIPRIRSPRGM